MDKKQGKKRDCKSAGTQTEQVGLLLVHNTILWKAEVEQICGLSCSTVICLLREGTFPQPTRIGPRLYSGRNRIWLDFHTTPRNW